MEDIEKKFLSAIRAELQSDIVSCAYLRSMLHRLCPDESVASKPVVISNAIECLLNEGLIVVGDTKLQDGLLNVQAWKVTKNQAVERVKSIANELDDEDDMGDGFWIQLRQHATVSADAYEWLSRVNLGSVPNKSRTPPGAKIKCPEESGDDE